MIARSSLAALLVMSAAFTAAAQDEVVGVWKRKGETERFYVIEKGDEGLTGRMVNPPFESMTCSLKLSIADSKLKGTCHWTETVDDKTYEADTAWEFTLEGDTLTGRAEAMDWEGGVVYHREWVAYTLDRVERSGLVVEGTAEEAFGDEISDLSALAGGWLGAGGAWSAALEGEELVLTAVGHREGVTIRLKNERGTLRGTAKLADGKTSKVELGFSEGELSGRSSWSAGPVEGWAPLGFKRLERSESGSAEAAAPAPGSGELSGVFKRDDGLYLRVSKGAEGVTGVLSDKSGKVSARVTFSEADGIWTGTVNWGDYETKWELAVGEAGLTGRCQWADTHEGKLVATGWSGRTFKPLKRVH